MNNKLNQLNIVVRLGAFLVIAIAISATTISDTFARGGRGGGGRGGGGGMSRGGGGYSRGGSYGGASRTPSISRSPSMSRPSTPHRSSTASRPSTANRGGASTANRGRAATANRGGATNRSTATGRAARGAHPTQSSLNSFLNMPSQGGNRAAAGAAGVGALAAGGNAAVNDFFSHNRASASHNAAATHTSAASNRQAGSVANQRSENISNRTDARSGARDSRGENRDFASDNRQDRVSGRGDNQAARVSNRGETRSSLAAGRGENRSQRQQQRSEHADNLRGALEDEFDSNHLFDDFWKNNPQAYYRFNQNPAFWTWATAATVGSFFGAGYSDGGGGEYYYDEGTVYSDGGQIPAEEYAEQAEEIVESAPEVENPDDMEWLPLGVFALAEDKNSDAAPNMFLQLAISKEGIVAGTYNNKSTDETKSVEGMVDMESGRAAWTIAGKSTPIMETQLDSLTENETNVLIHFDDGTTQQWLMLHMEKPAEDK